MLLLDGEVNRSIVGLCDIDDEVVIIKFYSYLSTSKFVLHFPFEKCAKLFTPQTRRQESADREWWISTGVKSR